ncbi:MAG TPA: cytochrome c maturation protein CcmE [Acidimicrobiales bacterium]
MDVTETAGTTEAGTAADVDLSPRPDDDRGAGGTRSGRRVGGSGRRWLVRGVIVAILAVVGVLVYKGLSDAALYFRPADEAVAQREELGTRRFRLQGAVVDDPVEVDGGIEFQVVHNDVTVDVHHTGSPPDMFAVGIPVVLEGRWDESGEFFASDHILVKHDETYESQEDYEERMAEAREDSADTDAGSGDPADTDDADTDDGDAAG